MNSLQILKVFEANTKESKVIELDMAIKFHDEWLTTYINGSTSTDSRAEKISALYMSAMKGMTSKLTKTMSSYDKYALYIGMCLLVQSFLGTLCIHFNFISDDLLRHSFLQSSTGFLVIFLATGFTACIHLHCCSMQSLGKKLPLYIHVQSQKGVHLREGFGILVKRQRNSLDLIALCLSVLKQ